MIVHGDGRQTRDFTYVADTARGILAAGWADAAIGETIDLGSGRETSINDLAAAVAEVVGSLAAPVEHHEPRPGDVRRLWADGTKARRLLGFEPSVDLRTGLASLKEWYASLGRSPAALLEEEVERTWEARREPPRQGALVRTQGGA
jgi:UDP-glucose 4-epimerase